MDQVIAGAGSRSNTIFAVTCSVLCLATAFLIMRMISKLWLVRKPTWDDLVIFVGWVLAVGLSASLMYGSRVGLGNVAAQVPVDREGPLKRSAYAFTILYNPALTAIKLSILMLYFRMSETRLFFRYATLVVICIVVINGIVLTFLNIFQCRPIGGATSIEPAGTCVDIVTLYLCAAPVNILTDIAILVLPLPLITSMRLDTRQKVGLVATFMTGVFVTTIGVVRIAYLQLALMEQVGAGNVPTTLGLGLSSNEIANFLWHASYSFMWSVVEVNAGLICACALVIKPLLMRILPSKSRAFARSQSVAPPVDFRSTDAVELASISHPDGLDSKSSRPVCTENDSNNDSPLEAQGRSLPDNLLEDATCIAANEEMDVFEFLAAGDNSVVYPPLPELTQPHRSRRLSPVSVMHRWKGERVLVKDAGICQEPPTKFMDFVNLSKTKPLTELTQREAWWTVLFVALLSLTQGFAYGLLNALNGQLQSLSHYTSGQSLVLHNAYFCGYVLGPLAGYPIFTRAGFKATLITGLGVFTVAAFSFWPSSSLLSFPGFVISYILIGIGLSILQTAANTYISLAGPDELMESRLSFAQALQAIGAGTSPLLSVKVIFRTIGRGGVFKFQWLYLAIGFWTSLLGVIVYYVPLSECSDGDLERVARLREVRRGLSKQAKVCRINIIPFIACTSIFGLWMYLGAQEQLRYFWTTFVMEVKPHSTSSSGLNYYAVSLACFAASRFLTSLACYYGIPGRLILVFSVFGCLLMSVLSMLLPAGDGTLTCLMLLAFFEGPFFPVIVAMTLRGMGRQTKLVATGLTMAISGGAIIPSIAWAIQRDHQGNARFALRVSLITYSIMLLLTAMINLNATARHWVDHDRNDRRISEGDQGVCIHSVFHGEKAPEATDHSLSVMTGPEHIEHIECARPNEM